MSERIVVARSEKTGAWIKARSTGGCCFTLSFDNFEKLLQVNKNLKRGESIERLEIDQYGITIFIENADMSGGSKYRV